MNTLFADLPLSVNWRIVDFIPYTKIGACVRINKHAYAMMEDSDYWCQRIKNEFSDEAVKHFLNDITQIPNKKEAYLKLYSQQYCTYGSETYRPITLCLVEATRMKDEKLIRYFCVSALTLCPDVYTGIVAYYMAMYGHLDLLEKLTDLTSEANLSMIMSGAGIGNQQELIFHLLDKHNNDERWVGYAIGGASKRNHKDLIFKLLKRKFLIDHAMLHAAENGCVDLIKNLFALWEDKRVQDMDTDIQPTLDTDVLNNALYQACMGGHKDAVTELVRLGADDLLEGFVCTTSCGNSETLLEIIRLAAPNGITQEDINAGLDTAIETENENVFLTLLNLGANITHEVIEQIVLISNGVFVRGILNRDLPITLTQTQLNEMLINVSSNGDIETARCLIERGADDFNGAIKSALDRRHHKIAHILVELTPEGKLSGKLLHEYMRQVHGDALVNKFIQYMRWR